MKTCILITIGLLATYRYRSFKTALEESQRNLIEAGEYITRLCEAGQELQEEYDKMKEDKCCY